MLGAVAIIIAYLCNYRAEENLKQNNIANTLQRNRVEKNTVQANGDMAKVIVKARESYECLDDVEKVNLKWCNRAC